MDPIVGPPRTTNPITLGLVNSGVVYHKSSHNITPPIIDPQISHSFNFVTFLKYENPIDISASGPFFRNSSIKFCVEHYKAGNISSDLNFVMDDKIISNCIELSKDQAENFNTSKQWMLDNNLTMPWHAIERLELSFNLTSVTLKPLGEDYEGVIFRDGNGIFGVH